MSLDFNKLRELNKTLKSFGVGLHQTKFDRTKHGYVKNPPYTYSTYAPWFAEEWFREIYNKVADITDVSADRCYMIYMLARSCISINGDYAECGVYKGGTAMVICEGIESGWTAFTSFADRKMHLFDTFKGFIDNEDLSEHPKGDMSNTSIDEVGRNLSKYQVSMHFHVGAIPETFRDLPPYKEFAFVHVDVDLYSASKDCLCFFYPRLSRGGMIIFDDYGFHRYEMSQKLAVDEFFKDKIEKPISLRTGQCLVIKI